MLLHTQTSGGGVDSGALTDFMSRRRRSRRRLVARAPAALLLLLIVATLPWPKYTV